MGDVVPIATRRSALAALASGAALAVLGAAPSFANKPHGHTQKTEAPLPTRAQTRVYLMRGLFGVFSLGMDDLAGKLNAAGYNSSVYAWDNWPGVVDTISRRRADGDTGPVVVIGHSLGANSVFSVAGALQQQGIPIELAVTFDATEPQPVPANVAVFINFWARDGFGRPIPPSPNYVGDLEDIDLSNQPGIDHTTIDALDRFHQFVIGKLDAMTAPQ